MEKKYGIEVQYKNEWLLIKKTFTSEEEATKWAQWNYQRGGTWRVIVLATNSNK